MEKLQLKSKDLVLEGIKNIEQMFPGCIVESLDHMGVLQKSIDFDQLKQELSGQIVEGPQERYQINWPGKRAAIALANDRIDKTLRPDEAGSVDFDGTQNIFIEGDNLDALKLLQEPFLGRVKMIYIDPPYNTGKDFLYKDNFSENADEFLKKTNQVSETGARLMANTETSGRFHSDWLSFMYPRLKLARNLLSDDGVIFISIDDNEQANLKKLCDEIFGEQNNLVTHYIQVRYAGKTLAEKNNYQKLIEQVLVYQKSGHTPIKEVEQYSLDGFKWKITELLPGKKETIGGKDVEIFPAGTYRIQEVESSIDALKETWATGSVLKVNASGKYFGTYLAPRKGVDGLGTLYKVQGIGEDGLGFRYFTGPKRETATKGTFFSGVPSSRRSDIEDTGGSDKTKSIVNFYDFADSFGNCRHEGGLGFRGGKKPIRFIEKLISQSCSDGIILDFFAGSGSTAHAVLSSNFKDGGKRRFITVQIPEDINPDDKDFNDEFKTISELTKERIRRSADQLKEEYKHIEGVDVGFRSFKIDSSCFSEVLVASDMLSQDLLGSQIDNIKLDRTAEDLLFQVLLNWGVDISLNIERKILSGKEIFLVGENSLVACFDCSGGVNDALVKEIAILQPLRVVFRDLGFKDDSVKINVEQMFKLLSPHTEIKTI